MVAVPAATPVTIPVLPTVAVAVFDELQLPPVVVLARVMVAPVHARPGPVMAAGIVYTVTTVVTDVPEIVYMIVAVPADIPVTSPPEVTVATAVLVLLHAPPVGVHDSVVVAPVHTVVVPVIAPIVPLTVTTLVAEQPAADV